MGSSSFYLFLISLSTFLNNVFFLFFNSYVGFFILCWLQMWPDLIQKAKDGGVDVIQTYVFWNGHEPTPGNVMQIPFCSGF